MDDEGSDNVIVPEHSLPDFIVLQVVLVVGRQRVFRHPVFKEMERDSRKHE
jgi:hypothetical protein